MKIAFISLMRVFPWGGSEELWYRAAKLALKRGHTVITLTQQWETVPEKIKELQLLGADTKFYHRQQYSLLSRIAIKLKVLQPIEEVVPKVEADVYVVSNGTTWDFIYHRLVLANLLSQGQGYVLINQHSYENGSIVASSSRHYASQVLAAAKKVYFVSDHNWQASERQLACRISNHELINNPVNITAIGVKPYPVSSRLLMACVARLDCDYKGQDLLLEALSAEQWRSRDFSLKFYGAGPHLEYLSKLIELYGLQQKVSIEGYVQDVDRIWESNQVIVLPSLSEGTPLALVEAMLSGRAALATNVGDNIRYLLDGETGILASSPSVTGLAAGLESLWKKRGLLQRMGENAFQHANSITNFHPERNLIDFIESVTDNKVNLAQHV